VLVEELGLAVPSRDNLAQGITAGDGHARTQRLLDRLDVTARIRLEEHLPGQVGKHQRQPGP